MRKRRLSKALAKSTYTTTVTKPTSTFSVQSFIDSSRLEYCIQGGPKTGYPV